MCLDINEKATAIKFVDNHWRDFGRRCAVIMNRGGNIEIVPEMSLPIQDTQIIYQLKP